MPGTDLIRTALNLMTLTQADRLAAPFARGRGVIFTLHRVRPARGDDFQPNALLEITPEFLDAAIHEMRAAGYDIVDLDEGWRRLETGEGRRFCVLTFDDACRDVLEHAVPVLSRWQVPFHIFIATDLTDGRGGLWWLELEAAIAAMTRLEVVWPEGQREAIDTTTAVEKNAAWRSLYWRLRALPEPAMREVIARLSETADVDPAAIARETCATWDELRALARSPLVRFGAHTVSHPMLAKWPFEAALGEMTRSRARITEELGRCLPHLAYPVGDASAAGSREFEMARTAGFSLAVTTRPGHLFRAHLAHPTALPRVSLNGLYQERAFVRAFLSGLPFLLHNRGRRAVLP